MFHEAARVLRYPRFQQAQNLTEDGIYQYIAFLRLIADIVILDPTLMVPIRDVNDIIVAQTAILGEADVLCTLDQDFYEPATQDFLAHFGIKVMTDIELIHILRKQAI